MRRRAHTRYSSTTVHTRVVTPDLIVDRPNGASPIICRAQFKSATLYSSRLAQASIGRDSLHRHFRRVLNKMVSTPSNGSFRPSRHFPRNPPPTIRHLTDHIVRPRPTTQSETGLPPSWEVRHSNSKNLPYYFNTATNASCWEPPAETDTDKLKSYMAAHHTATSAGVVKSSATRDVKDVDKIRAAHLLVKHRDSRRPSSWRQGEVTRTKEEAKEVLRGHEERIRAGETSLGAVATSESDCSSARKQGDL